MNSQKFWAIFNKGQTQPEGCQLTNVALTLNASLFSK